MNKNILDAPERENLSLKKVTSIDRLKSMLLDHFLMTMILTILAILPMTFMIKTKLEDNTLTPNLFEIFFMVSISVLYLLKDTLNSRSLAKRYMGQIIIDSKTKLPAAEIKCLIRNITIPLWIIEVFVVLISPSKRIGDIIAGTEIKQTDYISFSDTKMEFLNYKKLNFIKLWFVATAFIFGIFYVL